MNQRQWPFLSTFVLAFCCILPGAMRAQNSSSSGQTKAYTPVPGFDASAMDTTADPCVDFYQYACGNFSKNHPLPSDRPSFDEFTNLREYNTQVLHKILEQAAAAHAPAGSDEQKIGDYYASCMDTAAIEKKGLMVLNPQLNAIAALKDKAALTPLIASMEKFETGAFFAIGSQQDFKNADLEIAAVDQGGLGLPEKDYYLRTDAKSVQTRAQYVQHLTNMLKLMGEPAAKAASDAAAVMAFETALAKSSMSAVDRRDPANIYHVMTVDALAAELPTLNLKQLLASSGVPHVETLNVASPEFFKNLDKTLQQTDLETLKTYLRIRLVESETMRLPKAFDDEHFNFFQRQLQGIPEQEPRYKRCVASTDSALGEDLGKFYVAQYFAGDSKAKTLDLVNRIEASMRQDLEQLTWMSPETKAKAEEKLRLVTNKIGYPQKWRNYSSLEILPGDAMGNSLRARKFDLAYQLNKIGKPVDRGEWEMTPPTVNAYYDPSMNNINFPAGILQPPFYGKNASDATNLGHIGSVVGHELTHGFDDEGRQFDGHGNLVDWWTPADAKRFASRADCLVNQYGGMTAVDDLHVNGKLTLGENTADNGGLRLAFMAFMAQAAADHVNLEQKADGLTPLQHFFLGWAQNWCATLRPEYVRMLVQTDPHSPDRIRANGVLMNVPEFGQAFGCKKNQPMVPANICRVW
ncbi:MAG TPA: M13 family metallopeptidase [Acidobacteriaceae bacterium]|nr:M13 family metallopeptidase [Acidobacteriaceae bacterium]